MAGVDSAATQQAFAALVGASFATSLISAAVGLGGGVALLALLAALLPPAALIPVHGMVQLGSNAGRAAIMARHVDRRALIPFFGGAALGALAGGAMVVDLSPHWVQIGVGAFILWSIAARPPAFFRRAAAPTGAISSFLSMFFGATGPFVAAYVRALGLDRLGVVATHAAFMTAQHLLKTLAFGLFGFAFAAYLPLIAAMLAAGFAGTVAGKRMLMRLPEARFRLALNAILIALALRLLWNGVQGAAS
ncbi:MAG: sulfite exporter TauE/SafE family protein [Alphaproteobacteria bacterium HGW-Alphaproteobacteria-10]|nr:MAG: sulfite exporter TauE/SafE family protein [Alphaproteobacteria bacterium HGW-Alphaproteobacteria-10]